MPPACSDSRPLGSPPPDCQSCGVCCFSDLPEYVRVWGVDYDRLGEDASSYTLFLGNRCFLRLEDGHCAALQIDADQRRFTCALYEVRPDTCRSLIAGTSACLGEIHEKGERPLRAIEAILKRRQG